MTIPTQQELDVLVEKIGIQTAIALVKRHIQMVEAGKWRCPAIGDEVIFRDGRGEWCEATVYAVKNNECFVEDEKHTPFYINSEGIVHSFMPLGAARLTSTKPSRDES
jgi:hypothetical protein